MTHSRAKRRPRTRVVLCPVGMFVPTGRVFVLHLMPDPYTEEHHVSDRTDSELADDSMALLTDGTSGRYACDLAPLAICGERVREVPRVEGDVLAVPRCPNCFGSRA